MRAPRLAREYLELHRAYRQADERLKLADQAMSLDEDATASSLLPYEEVRDFFHYQDNYLDDLDVAAEALAAKLPRAVGMSPEAGLEATLEREIKVSVERNSHDTLMRAYDPTRRLLTLNAAQPTETRSFQMAFHLVSEILESTIHAALTDAALRSQQAMEVCRVGLTNYAAAAFLMPYRRFRSEALRLRHDIEQLSLLFGASLEQVCHRLSTLQRPGERGVPLYFLRMDRAGNITKRHSATHFHFARFGGACPLWNLHEAFSIPDRFLVEIAEMPDGGRYLSVARSILKPSGAFAIPARRYVIGFGCEIEHAAALVYTDAVAVGATPTPVGVSCRICERTDCTQRAFPPIDRQIAVSHSERHIVPFSIAHSRA
jgi:XRE family transcriptional regulator, fatty acid utilization regulator